MATSLTFILETNTTFTFIITYSTFCISFFKISL